MYIVFVNLIMANIIMKKLMLLGGISYLLPAIEEAHKHGCKVITVDYLPNNIAHKFSDDYYNVSIIDKDKILQLAKHLNVDGILSYAVDPGVVTAAYVAEQMNLPFSCSYESACILQDKAKFRQFLKDNGFNVPNAKGYTNFEDALRDIANFDWPVMVKPVDSAGSKGISRVDKLEGLKTAVAQALEESHSGRFIIEDFLEKEGLSSGSESFFVDGNLLFNAFYDQYFDNEAINPYTPSAECWPSSKSDKVLSDVKQQLQRLSKLLGFRTGLFNVEFRLCKNGKVYLMEVSPRAGGNRLSEILNYATDINIIEKEIRKAIGVSVGMLHEPNYNGFYAICVLHSLCEGFISEILIEPCFKAKHVIEEEYRFIRGDKVTPFYGANSAIGTLFLRFDSYTEMISALENQSEWMNLIYI